MVTSESNIPLIQTHKYSYLYFVCLKNKTCQSNPPTKSSLQMQLCRVQLFPHQKPKHQTWKFIIIPTCIINQKNGKIIFLNF